jgi:Flp pilus assembly pilin Flp
MDRMRRLLHRISIEEEGQDMVEYVLIFALVSIVAITAVATTGGVIKGFWESIQGVLENL